MTIYGTMKYYCPCGRIYMKVFYITILLPRRRTSAYGYFADSAPKASTRAVGETSVMWKMYVQARSGGRLPPFEGETNLLWPP